MSSPPSPPDPRLTGLIESLRDSNSGIELYDAQWTLVWLSDEMKKMVEETDDAKLGIGKHMFEAVCMNPVWISKLSPESYFEQALTWTPVLIENTPGGAQTLLEIARRAMRRWDPPPQISDADLAAWFDELEPVAVPPVLKTELAFVNSPRLPGSAESLTTKVFADDGEHIGFLIVNSTAMPASLLGMLTRGDLSMFERMARLAEPGRREAAILFADLQSSAALSRRLPSAAYFRLIGRLTTETDAVVGKGGGVVGKHAGDGFTAFFLADELGGPSGAARSAIATARALSDLPTDVAKELGDELGTIESDELLLNVGVHWGATLYMGQLVTGGRLEVTALGDEVNECARVQQAACDGELLASKTLMERLTEEDAAALGLAVRDLRYLTIGEIPTAPEKAKRDAGGLPVTVL